MSLFQSLLLPTGLEYLAVFSELVAGSEVADVADSRRKWDFQNRNMQIAEGRRMPTRINGQCGALFSGLHLVCRTVSGYPRNVGPLFLNHSRGKYQLI